MARSIEDEICHLAEGGSVEACVKKLGIIPEGNRFLAVEVCSDWVRSGAETYLCRFDVVSEECVVPLVAKACVAFGVGRSLGSILLNWVERRRILAEAGVSTPRLYAYGEGILLEERIPMAFADAIDSSLDQFSMACNSAVLAGRVVRQGFAPRQLLSDLMSRGDDAVLVDFGEDLGEPQAGRLESDGVRRELASFMLAHSISESSIPIALFEREIAVSFH